MRWEQGFDWRTKKNNTYRGKQQTVLPGNQVRVLAKVILASIAMVALNYTIPFSLSRPALTLA